MTYQSERSISMPDREPSCAGPRRARNDARRLSVMIRAYDKCRKGVVAMKTVLIALQRCGARGCTHAEQRNHVNAVFLRNGESRVGRVEGKRRQRIGSADTAQLSAAGDRRPRVLDGAIGQAD
jgi:hypothetical protein